MRISQRLGSSVVRWFVPVVAALGGVFAVAMAHDSVGTASSSNVPIPASGAYFGAWANPSGVVSPTSAEVEQFAEELEAAIGRPLRLHMHYYPWSLSGGASFPDQAMLDDVANGRTPVVTWACGDLNSRVKDGHDDAVIDATADAVKAFGKPIFIRWYWEMNLAPGTNHQDCMGPGTVKQVAPGYIEAWTYIHDRFAARGVSNVSWLWNPAAAPGDPDPAPYYPGDPVVDWIGFDGYDKHGYADFGAVFDNFYTNFSSHAKPFLVAETGECAAEQAVYLARATAEIQSANVGNPLGYEFPAVKGFMYFDAPGGSICPWSLVGTGLKAFARMGADPYFKRVP